MPLRPHLLGLALLTALAPLPAAATTVRGPADLATLARAADAVVHGRVIRIRSGWAGGDRRSGLIFTTVTLAADAAWKGALAGQQLEVRVPGGAADELAQTVEGVAAFSEGEEVVLFLRRIGGAPLFEVHQWALGKFTVSGSAGAARARRDRGGLHCAACTAAEKDELPLSELQQAVQAALQQEPRP
jgi:hypothetical protein